MGLSLTEPSTFVVLAGLPVDRWGLVVYRVRMNLPHDLVKDGRDVPDSVCPQCLEVSGTYIGRAKMRDIFQCNGTIGTGGSIRACNTIFYSSHYTPTYVRDKK